MVGLVGFRPVRVCCLFDGYAGGAISIVVFACGRGVFLLAISPSDGPDHPFAEPSVCCSICDASRPANH